MSWNAAVRQRWSYKDAAPSTAESSATLPVRRACPSAPLPLRHKCEAHSNSKEEEHCPASDSRHSGTSGTSERTAIAAGDSNVVAADGKRLRAQLRSTDATADVSLQNNSRVGHAGGVSAQTRCDAVPAKALSHSVVAHSCTLTRLLQRQQQEEWGAALHSALQEDADVWVQQACEEQRLLRSQLSFALAKVAELTLELRRLQDGSADGAAPTTLASRCDSGTAEQRQSRRVEDAKDDEEDEALSTVSAGCSATPTVLTDSPAYVLEMEAYIGSLESHIRRLHGEKQMLQLRLDRRTRQLATAHQRYEQSYAEVIQEQAVLEEDYQKATAEVEEMVSMLVVARAAEQAALRRLDEYELALDEAEREVAELTAASSSACTLRHDGGQSEIEGEERWMSAAGPHHGYLRSPLCLADSVGLPHASIRSSVFYSCVEAADGDGTAASHAASACASVQRGEGGRSHPAVVDSDRFSGGASLPLDASRAAEAAAAHPTRDGSVSAGMGERTPRTASTSLCRFSAADAVTTAASQAGTSPLLVLQSPPRSAPIPSPSAATHGLSISSGLANAAESLSASTSTRTGQTPPLQAAEALSMPRIDVNAAADQREQKTSRQHYDDHDRGSDGDGDGAEDTVEKFAATSTVSPTQSLVMNGSRRFLTPLVSSFTALLAPRTHLPTRRGTAPPPSSSSHTNDAISSSCSGSGGDGAVAKERRGSPDERELLRFKCTLLELELQAKEKAHEEERGAWEAAMCDAAKVHHATGEVGARVRRATATSRRVQGMLHEMRRVWGNSLALEGQLDSDEDGDDAQTETAEEAAVGEEEEVARRRTWGSTYTASPVRQGSVGGSYGGSGGRPSPDSANGGGREFFGVERRIVF